MDGYEKVTVTGTVPAGSGYWNLSAECPEGKSVVGGGWSASAVENGMRVLENKPFSNGKGWDVNFKMGSDPVSVAVYAICLND